MSKEKLLQSKIAETIRENIADKKAVFVFNTAVAVESWTDFIVLQNGQDGWPHSVAAERFIAWDEFKGQAASVREKDSSSVPALVRKLYARSLLSEICSGKAVFEKIINSKYAESALAFTDWLSQILPSLGSWRTLMEEKKFFDGKNFAFGHDTPENRDYLKLYNLYSDFLKEKKLFEPTWQELEFNSKDGRHYIIFYPELMDDFVEYREILEAEEKKGTLELVHLEKNQKETEAAYYSSMRTELRMTALGILKENKNGTDWNNIALCVPNLESYLPYIERELKLYNIPYTVRAGTMLGKTGAGLIFRKMLECCSSGFAFANVRAFALDYNFPWANKEALRLLVRLGSELRCLRTFMDDGGMRIDPWEQDLPEGIKTEDGNYVETKKFYSMLKKSVKALCEASSFSAIKSAWVGADGFEEKFLVGKDSMDSSSNNILSRCVRTLDALIQMEKEYPELCGRNISHFEFFLQEIESTQYREQTQKAGISVFPYKLSAMAAFEKQFVINASQDAVTVENPLLSFLPQKERRLLFGENAAQNDESQSYIAAYSGTGDCVFSIAETTLGGYAIPYAALKTPGKPCDSNPALEEEDYIRQEKLFLCGAKSDFPQKISAELKEGFDFYFRANGFDSDADTNTVSPAVRKKVSETAGRGSPGEIHISQTSLKTFSACPRKWLFKSVVKLEEDSLDNGIFTGFDTGNINHKILELYLKQTEKLPVSSGTELENEKEIAGQIRTIINDGVEIDGRTEYPFNVVEAYRNSSLAKAILDSQKEIFVQNITGFLRWFCTEELYGGWYINCVEKDLSYERGDGLWFEGKLDCILSKGEDSSIVDFKSAKIPDGPFVVPRNAVDSPENTLGDFQMPMYFYLCKESSRNFDINGAHFVSINGCSGQEVIVKEGPVNARAANKAVVKDFEEYTIPLFKDYAENMFRAVGKYNFSLGSTERKTCTACSYKSVCRTLYNTAGSSLIGTGE